MALIMACAPRPCLVSRLMVRITGARTLDVRAPTSRTLAGSDAVHTDPDYSGVFVVLETDGELEGVGMTFTIGRGNDLCCAAIEQLAPLWWGASSRRSSAIRRCCGDGSPTTVSSAGSAPTKA